MLRRLFVRMIPPMRDTSRRLYYGWFVLAAVSGMNFANSATAIAVLSVFILPLSADFGWTRTQISAVTSVGAIVGALIASFAGRLVDRRGARLPLTLGGVCIESCRHCVDWPGTTTQASTYGRVSPVPHLSCVIALASQSLSAPAGVQRYTSPDPR